MLKIPPKRQLTFIREDKNPSILVLLTEIRLWAALMTILCLERMQIFVWPN